MSYVDKSRSCCRDCVVLRARSNVIRRTRTISCRWRSSVRLRTPISYDPARSSPHGSSVSFAPEELGESIADASQEGQADMLAVQEALERLPDEQRLAVALVLVEGLSYKEAAGIMDVPIGTLTSRLARARGALQVMLGASAGAAQ